MQTQITLFLENNLLKDIPSYIFNLLSKVKYDNFTDEEKYIIKTPNQILLYKKGICYDIVETQRFLFNKYNYETKTFFSYKQLPIEDNPTHTYIIFKENNKYYWMECSWQSYKEIHGPFNSYIHVVSYVEKLLKQEWKNIYTIEYKSFDYKNMNINQFGNFIIKGEY